MVLRSFFVSPAVKLGNVDMLLLSKSGLFDICICRCPGLEQCNCKKSRIEFVEVQSFLLDQKLYRKVDKATVDFNATTKRQKRENESSRKREDPGLLARESSS